MRRLNQDRGFSLVEVMVALVISTLLLGGLVTTFTSANTSYAELTKTSRQIENGRYAISVLEQDLRHAGFWGEYTGDLASRDPRKPPAMLDKPQPCTDGPAEFRAQLMMPVYGYDGDAVTPLPCITNYMPGTDVLVIRRLSTERWPITSLLLPGMVYFQGYLDPPLAKGPYLDYGDKAAFDSEYPLDIDPVFKKQVPIRQFLEHIYYISQCRDCTGGGDGIPTLTRLEYTGNAQFATVPLAEGIEKMRVLYGVDTTLTHGAPTKYKTADVMFPEPDWDSVMAVQINLLARSTVETPGYKDTKTFMLGDLPVAAANDAYRRHAFSQVVRLKNPAGKWEDVAVRLKSTGSL